MLHGWIILDKPVGLGSTQAVSAVKRALRQAGEPKTKVGHGGTLDPLASGVLPIALGEATKLAGRMLDATKDYEFSIRFGEETDTLDAEGQVVATSVVRPTRAEIEAVLPRFTGAIEQVPPAYSALKIEGKAAYARARAGEEVEMQPRSVTIHPLRLVSATADEATLAASVSKGTYIRSLARDIAVALNSVGHVTMLRRTATARSKPSTPSASPVASSVQGLRLVDERRAVLEAALDDIPALPVTPGQARLLRHGQVLAGFPERPGLQLATEGSTPVALVEAAADGLRVVRGFNIEP